jgi:hypothetical protein
MGIHVSTGEILSALDLVTTPSEIIEELGIKRGTLRNWMSKDYFEWVQIRRTVLIDRESFLEFYNKSSPTRLDNWIAKR